MYVYIYIYMYNRHLGLINAPLICVFPPNDLCHYSFTIKKVRNIQNYGQDLINPSGDTSCSSWGSSWGSSIFSQNETPQQVISCTCKVSIKRSTFWAPETRALLDTPRSPPRWLQVVFAFVCLLIFPGIVVFVFINFRGPRTLLIGGIY